MKEHLLKIIQGADEKIAELNIEIERKQDQGVDVSAEIEAREDLYVLRIRATRIVSFLKG